MHSIVTRRHHLRAGLDSMLYARIVPNCAYKYWEGYGQAEEEKEVEKGWGGGEGVEEEKRSRLYGASM